jgi:hypothetical protein
MHVDRGIAIASNYSHAVNGMLETSRVSWNERAVPTHRKGALIDHDISNYGGTHANTQRG